MKHYLVRSFLTVSGILLALCISTPISHAQGTDLAPFILRFIENGSAQLNANQSIALIFAMKEDGTALLLAEHKIPDSYDTYVRDDDVLWQKPGTVSPDQVKQMLAAQQTLSGLPDQYWPTQDYAVDLPNAGGSTPYKRLLLNHTLKRGSAKDQETLQGAIQTILDVRKTFEPLVVFSWSGGFAGRSTRLTVFPDGQVTYEDKRRRTTVIDRITPPDMEVLQRLLHTNPYLLYSPSVKQSCADCWFYSVISITQDGLKGIELDQITLNSAPQSFQTIVTLLADLSDQEALVRVSLTPAPTLTPTATELVRVQPPTATLTAFKATVTPAGSTASPQPTPDQWGSELTATDNHIELDVLETSDDLFIGAVKRFQLQPGEAPKDCVVFVIRGPMALAVGLFGPGWVERRYNMTDAMIATRIQDGIDLLSQYCNKEKIQVMRVP